MIFTWAHCLSPSRPVWMASHPSGLLTAPCSFLSWANVLRVRLILLSISLMMLLKSTSLRTDPCRAPLFTDLCPDIELLTTDLLVQSCNLFFVHQTVNLPSPCLSNLEKLREKDVIGDSIKGLTEVHIDYISDFSYLLLMVLSRRKTRCPYSGCTKIQILM